MSILAIVGTFIAHLMHILTYMETVSSPLLLGLSPAGVVNNTVTLVNIVQYILVRRDLLSHLEWPVGAVIAQACHASSAAIHLFYDDSVTQAYLKDLDNMHKVILEVI